METSTCRQEVKELELNTLLTVEMIVGFRRNTAALFPLHIMDRTEAPPSPGPEVSSTDTPLSKRTSRDCPYFTSWGRSSCHSSALQSLNSSSALLWLSGSAQLPNQTLKISDWVNHTPSTLRELHTFRVRRRVGKSSWTLTPEQLLQRTEPEQQLLPSGDPSHEQLMPRWQ